MKTPEEIQKEIRETNRHLYCLYKEFNFYLESITGVLTIREKKILRRRFALTSGGRKTTTALAKELGITQERVRDIETMAIKKLSTEELKMRFAEKLLKLSSKGYPPEDITSITGVRV